MGAWIWIVFWIAAILVTTWPVAQMGRGLPREDALMPLRARLTLGEFGQTRSSERMTSSRAQIGAHGMNDKSMIAGLAIASLLVVAGLPTLQGVRAESGTPTGGPASGMVVSQDCPTTMMSMMRMMHQHQHHGMMDDGAGMMGAGPEGMMDDGAGMMGAGPEGMMDDGAGMMGAGPEGMMDDGAGMMGAGPEGMMDDGAGMMGDSAEPAPSTVSPNTDRNAATPSPAASLGVGHEQHHPAASPAATAGAS